MSKTIIKWINVKVWTFNVVSKPFILASFLKKPKNPWVFGSGLLGIGFSGLGFLLPTLTDKKSICRIIFE